MNHRVFNAVLHLFFQITIVIATSTGLSQHFELSPSTNLTVTKGSTVSIPCRVRNRQGECLWSHNAVGIGPIARKYEFQRAPQNGECSLTIYDVSLESDDGNWQCQVAAAAIGQETLQSDIINLLVLITPERPTLRRTHPYTPELQVFVDRTNDIECQVANGNPAAKISWLLNGKNITEFADTTISRNDKTLAWTVVSKLNRYAVSRAENKYNLTCYAQHPTGNQGDSVVLNALYAPIVNVSSNRYQAMEGSDFRVECKVDANPKGTVIWRRRGSNTPVQRSPRVDPSVLEFAPIQRDLNGAQFECQAQNEYGASQPAIITLDVLYTPRLLNTSNAQSVLTGNPAKLHCYYDGNPTPFIKWFHINPRTGETDLVSAYPNDKQVLEIRNATYVDEGEYYCEATNRINTIDYVVRSSNIVLDVYGLPAFLSKTPVDSEGRRGGQSHVSMWFCSDPPPSKVYWQFGSIRLDVKTNAGPPNSAIPPNSSLHSRYVVKPIVPLHSKRTLETASHCFDSTLLIKDTDLSDQRDYTLTIENERGVQEGVVQLRVTSPLSATLLIATALSVIIVVFVVTVITLMFVRRKRKGDQNIRDEEAKEDAQALSQNLKSSNGSDGGQTDKDIERNGRRGENHELVYANLEFGKDGKPPVAQKPLPRVHAKPVVVQRSQITQMRSQGNSTEYAQIAFTNKADL